MKEKLVEKKRLSVFSISHKQSKQFKSNRRFYFYMCFFLLLFYKKDMVNYLSKNRWGDKDRSITEKDRRE